MNPSSADRVTKQIQNTLGDFQKVYIPCLDEPKRYLWADGSSRGAFPVPLQTGSNLSRPPQSLEFKKPHQSNARLSSHNHRNLIKPNDGKPNPPPPPSSSYENRSYQNQSAKHGNNINNHRPNGILPSKGPPPHQTSSTSPLSSNSSSRLHTTARNLPRISLYQQVSTIS